MSKCEYCMTYPRTIDEIRMTSVNVASLHIHQVSDQFVGRIHHFLEKGDHHLMELFLQSWISSECGLGQELGENSNKFVIH
jgi:hypothetical protein